MPNYQRIEARNVSDFCSERERESMSVRVLYGRLDHKIQWRRPYDCLKEGLLCWHWLDQVCSSDLHSNRMFQSNIWEVWGSRHNSRWISLNRFRNLRTLNKSRTIHEELRKIPFLEFVNWMKILRKRLEQAPLYTRKLLHSLRAEKRVIPDFPLAN